MIYWSGQKAYRLMVQTCFPQGIWFNYKRNMLDLPRKYGRGFTENFAIVYKSSIKIYDKLSYCGKRKALSIDTLPIVSDTSTEFPDRFAIQTKNIDLLRELIASGKKVSWLNPDLYTQAHWLGILNFEHVFLEFYINTHIVYPSGEVVEAKDALHKSIFGHWKIKYAKRIGVYFNDIHERIDWLALGRSRWKKNKNCKNNWFITPGLAVNIYNVYSITYLIWQQSKLNATTVQKKIAKAE